MLQPDRIDRNVVNDFYASIDTNRPGGVEEFVKLQREDYHLLIGITKQSVLLAARGIGFPHNYSRRAAFQARGQTDWITPLHGDDLTGYDFAEQIKMWMRDSGNEAWSLAEVWLPRRNSGVGTADGWELWLSSDFARLTPTSSCSCYTNEGGCRTVRGNEYLSKHGILNTYISHRFRVLTTWAFMLRCSLPLCELGFIPRSAAFSMPALFA
ncbi:unnamed protein product [Prorocentrum cordatum]|uniref:Uncharacterized protein n=1 Tax=Prorocentrum cordatum TaxID=2364126 RepID=A0ABN9WMF4_9DINO|nr:unnamed protein product [Polarella glacialis]